MARPARRRTTLPPHDPRAIRGALRREIYELGDSLRFLDDIEFVVIELEGVGPAIRPIVNGIDLAGAIDHEPLSTLAGLWSLAGLSDADGQREGVPFAGRKETGGSGCLARLGIAVAGRYVRWTLDDAFDNEVFVFDRATYRERLAAVLAANRDHERTNQRLLREFYERTPWEGPLEMGLEDPMVCWPSSMRRIQFLDPLWHAEVIILGGLPGEPLDEYLARATRLIARWDLNELQAFGRGPVRPPYFPKHWGFSITSRNCSV